MSSNPDAESEKDRERKEFDRYKGYDTEEGYVIYDTHNPKSWIKSSEIVEAEEKV